MSTDAPLSADPAAYQMTIRVEPEYLPSESAPDEGRFLFAYHVTITNTGQMAAQVIARHWIITDGTGHVQEVQGLAVVGH